MPQSYQGFDPHTPHVIHIDRSPPPGGSCISAAEAAVFTCSLSIVFSLCHSLPVSDVPEQPSIASMRNDVIYNLSGIYPAAMLAEVIDSDRMSPQIGS